MVRKYVVDIARTAYHRFAVEAETPDEARAKAEQLAYDTVWSGFPAEYKILDAAEVPE